jgi:hypothetical protein
VCVFVSANDAQDRYDQLRLGAVQLHDTDDVDEFELRT